MNLYSSLTAVSNRPVFFFVDSVKTTSYHRSSKVLGRGIRSLSVSSMASQQKNCEELDEKARHGETVVPGGTGGKSLEAQEHLAEGRSRGGQTRKQQLGSEGYHGMGTKGGQTRKEQMGKDGVPRDGKGGLSTMDKSGEERAEEEGMDIDESKFRNQ